jgi:ferric-dicitrate binding protein FerR (iron transport regulator)
MNKRNVGPAKEGSARAMQSLVRELKSTGPRPRDEEAWASVEARLVARLRAEDAREAKPVRPVAVLQQRPLHRHRAWLAVGGFAAAAGLAFFIRQVAMPQTVPGTVASIASGRTDRPHDTLKAFEGATAIYVNENAMGAVGHELAEGDAVRVDQGARATFERAGKVSWLLEGDGTSAARAHLKATGETLIVALEEGAIEAQVTPVPKGEAFAVDVRTGEHLVRVAVHGTHFRVARQGSMVHVDLTEGVISIGTPPPSGMTHGHTLTAPAHVEFDVSSVNTTWKEAQTVRSPVPLTPAPNAVSNDGIKTLPMIPHVPVADGTPSANTKKNTAPVFRPDETPKTEVRSSHEQVLSAVRECAFARLNPTVVRVSVTSTLELHVGAHGEVESARFAPPLLPEIQSCAAATIYKMKLEDSAGATLSIPVEFSY